MSKQIEIEHRSRFTEKKYKELLSFLKENGEYLGKDDKNVYFFTLPDKLLKVTDNISKGTAKITVKTSKIGQGSDFEEVEFFISPQDAEKAVHLFKILGFTKIHSSFQKRENFRYKEVEISVKYSDVWGYHAEFELMVNSVDKKEEADRKIKEVARGLGVDLMSEEELQDFISKKEKQIFKN